MTVLERFDADAIEAEIITLQHQRAKLKSLKDADPELMFEPWPTPAALRIDAKLKELRNARDCILAGDIPDEKQAPPPAPAPRRALQIPFFLPHELDVRDAPAVARPSSKEQQDEYQNLMEGYYYADTISGVENIIAECVAECGAECAEFNTERAFTTAIYVGLVKNLSILEAHIRGGLHYHLNRRREIEDRLKVLESRPSIEYAGVFDAEREYQPGNMITHDGSLWHVNSPTRGEVPGKGSSAFTLAVKRGRDGRA